MMICLVLKMLVRQGAGWFIMNTEICGWFRRLLFREKTKVGVVYMSHSSFLRVLHAMIVHLH